MADDVRPDSWPQPPPLPPQHAAPSAPSAPPQFAAPPPAPPQFSAPPQFAAPPPLRTAPPASSAFDAGLHTAGWGSPTSHVASTIQEPPPPRPAPRIHYAGFWLRFVAYWIDSSTVWVCIAGTLLATEWMGMMFGSTIGAITAVLTGIAALAVYYHRIPRQLSDRGATMGMRLVGLQLLGAGDGMYLGRGMAVLRCALGLGMPAALGILTRPLQIRFVEWLVDRGVLEGTVTHTGIFEASGSTSFLLVLYLLGVVVAGLPALVNLTNRRRQTAYDMITRSVVTRTWKR